VVNFLGVRPGKPIGEIACHTLLSRKQVVDVIASLHDEGFVMRIPRRGVGGNRNADGWALDPTSLHPPAAVEARP
jgi:hypothetical protein